MTAALIAELESPDDAARLAAAHALAQTGAPADLPALIARLDDPSDEVRDAASPRSSPSAGAQPALAAVFADPAGDHRPAWPRRS
jgi:HEAT repeat protein